MKHPQFTMNKYATAEDLYKGKAAYYQSVVEQMELKEKRAEFVACDLVCIDFELGSVTLEVPADTMQNGFSAGKVYVNFKEVQ